MSQSTMSWTAIAVGAACVIATGCSPDKGNGKIPTGQPMTGQGPPEDMSGGGDFAQPTGDLSLNGKCGVQNFMLKPGLPPEIMIVLDRSGSMDTALGSGTRWTEVTAAVKQVVTSLQGQIGWGLTVFPIDNDCGISSSVDVGIATGNGSTIGTKIDGYMPGGNTPTADAIKNAATYMASRTTSNPKYLLLSTDGEPNCSSATTCQCLIGSPNAMGECFLGPVDTGACVQLPDPLGGAPQALSDAANNGIHTFVVGVAADSTDNGALNSLATAGLEPRPGSTKYYPVGSETDLVNAVTTIAGQIISCSFTLTTAPPSDPTLVEINLNGMMIAHDTTHADGWDFGPGNTTILFYGAACTSLQSQTGSMVQAIYDCPPVM